MTSLPDDLRRAVLALIALAFACLICGGLYMNHYLFLDKFGNGLPDMSPTDSLLVFCFQAAAIACIVWANALLFVGSTAGARSVHRVWARATAREATRPWAWAAAATLAALYAAARLAFNEETVHAPLTAFTDGTSLLPFQYRALVPWVAAAIRAVAPTVSLPLVYGVLETLAAFAVWAALAALLRAVGWSREASRVGALGGFVLLALNLVAPWRHNAIYFPYDTPSVAFFAGGLALLLRGRMAPFYVLFAVATLNRETTCFLSVAYLALAWGRERPARIVAHLAAQVVLWAGLKAGLGALYADNVPLSSATGLFALMVNRSVRILTATPGWLYLALVPMGGLPTVLWLLRRRVADPRVRRLFWTVPPFFVGMTLVGELMEVRIYSELIPLVAVGLGAAVASVVREARVSVPEAVPAAAPLVADRA